MIFVRVSFCLIIIEPPGDIFEIIFNCSITSSIKFPMAYDLVLSAIAAMSMLSTTRNRWYKNVLDNRPQITDPLEYQKKLFLRAIFWVYFCSLHDMLNPYALNFAIKRSSERQSNAFNKSERSAPNDFPLSVIDFNFSSIYTRQCWALKPFIYPH